MDNNPTQAGDLPILMPLAVFPLLRFETVPLGLPYWPSWTPYSHFLDGFLLVADGINQPQVFGWIDHLLPCFFLQWLMRHSASRALPLYRLGLEVELHAD